MNDWRVRLIQWTEAVREEEARQERERREAAQLAAMKIEIKKMDEANQRAYKFLIDHLDERQQWSLHTNRYFEVKSQHGNRYRIFWGDSMNVSLLYPNGNRRAVLCALPHDVPVCDTMLAQFILLKCDEDYFLRIAHTVFD